MEIPAQLLNDIETFCKANDIKSVDKFIIKVLRRGFTVEKYGLEPEIKAQAVNTVTEVEKVEEVVQVVKEEEIKPINKNEDIYGEG